ncbi:MAG TPA: CehA/McbA family metallohydrolase [Candidatus Limnocylindrales bacterium]|nr:CehA/McbA family metallohydrolase [Candidatus Limnocylindrales bacterium]
MSSPGRADLHMHTTASDGWPEPHELVDHARATGLDVIAVTDHDTIEGALRAAEHAAARSKVHVVIGEEVSSRDGHIVGLFLERPIRPGMSAAATVNAIHEQDGLAVAVHPFWRTQRHTSGRVVHGVGWLAAELDFDAIEVENATPGFYVFNQMARRLNLGVGSAELGGSDAHILDAVGRAFTEFSGRTPKALRMAIEKGTTSAGRRRYRAMGLMRYAAWGLNHERYVAVV